MGDHGKSLSKEFASLTDSKQESTFPEHFCIAQQLRIGNRKFIYKSIKFREIVGKGQCKDYCRDKIGWLCPDLFSISWIAILFAFILYSSLCFWRKVGIVLDWKEVSLHRPIFNWLAAKTFSLGKSSCCVSIESTSIKLFQLDHFVKALLLNCAMPSSLNKGTLTLMPALAKVLKFSIGNLFLYSAIKKAPSDLRGFQLVQLIKDCLNFRMNFERAFSTRSQS